MAFCKNVRYFPCSLIIRYLSSPTFITLCAVFIGEEMVCRIVYNQAAGWDVRRCFFLSVWCCMSFLLILATT
ncbi:hypothetical protein GQP37_000103 [Salmonella enterica subsp. enterica serovar Newport]|nr:hypothetical protein [Salmonella enterica subsp. enterica serovar Newport]